jgi:hypothetical protein
MTEDNQLKDVNLVVSHVEYNNEGDPYVVSYKFAGDLQGSVDSFIQHVLKYEGIVELSRPTGWKSL